MKAFLCLRFISPPRGAIIWDSSLNWLLILTNPHTSVRTSYFVPATHKAIRRSTQFDTPPRHKTTVNSQCSHHKAQLCSGTVRNLMSCPPVPAHQSVLAQHTTMSKLPNFSQRSPEVAQTRRAKSKGRRGGRDLLSAKCGGRFYLGAAPN